jgi:hypothetical protein
VAAERPPRESPTQTTGPLACDHNKNVLRQGCPYCLARYEAVEPGLEPSFLNRGAAGSSSSAPTMEAWQSSCTMAVEAAAAVSDFRSDDAVSVAPGSDDAWGFWGAK